jgi:protein associated with RNAse G/E
MNYDEKLPFYYNNNQQFLQKRLDQKVIRDTKIFEKTQIKWFAFDELKKDIKQFRSFYQNIIHLILGNKSAIEGFVNKSFKRKRTINRKRRVLKTRKHKK